MYFSFEGRGNRQPGPAPSCRLIRLGDASMQTRKKAGRQADIHTYMHGRSNGCGENEVAVKKGKCECKDVGSLVGVDEGIHGRRMECV